MSKKLLFLAFLSIFFTSCKKSTFEKAVAFPKDATLNEKIELASRVVPTKKQLDWQKLETTAFIHFGINTFTGREWGDGNENPQLFYPTNLNTDQWAECLKKAGFKLVIITAKHHDGFCLWQTTTTNHSVAATNWRNGKGDVVRDLQNSCAKYGLKFGIYLSPWDRNAECYGNSPVYNEFFKNQLRELLSNYGPIDEVWFDGACGEGPNGKIQEYDFASYYQLIYELQPNAVVAIMGDDIRWCGNESGLGRDTEWSVTPLKNDAYPENKILNKNLDINNMSKDLGSRELLKNATSVNWWPSEVDVSIRPRWFYTSNDDNKVKSEEQLVDIYFNSVGKNAVLLLNVPPNKEGLIAKPDSINLIRLGDFLSQMYKRNYISDSNTYWCGNLATGEKIYNLSSNDFFNVVELNEDITKGQRIEKFSIYAYKNNKWELLTQGTTIGYKRLLRFPAVKTEKIKLVIHSSRGQFYIKNIKAYKAKEFITPPTISRTKNRVIEITGNKNSTIHFTTDGTSPNTDSPIYTTPFPFNQKGVIKAIAFFDGGKISSDVVSYNLDIPKNEWEIVDVTDQVDGYNAFMAIDDDEKTFWHTRWEGELTPLPHYICVDCKKDITATGFSFYPRDDGSTGGIPFRYDFLISNDGKNWTKIIANKEFSNIKNNPQPQIIKFDKKYNFRFFKFVAQEEVEGNNWISVAEIDILTN